MNLKTLIVTRGKNGASIYGKKNEYSFKPDVSKYIGTPDVTGCGDAFDISFCYYSFIKKLIPAIALELASTKATRFAYKPIKDRLC